MRPRKCRHIQCEVNADYFKPRGIPMTELEEMTLSLEELEAVRLADAEGLYHEDAATSMNVSRPTFGRTLQSARKKIANCIVNGKALKINTTKENTNETMLPGKRRKRSRKQGL